MMKREKVAVNLLWLRPGKVGGTEFYTRNLFDGFLELEEDYKLVLICTENNVDSFRHYADDDRFEILTVPISNVSIGKRIIWQNLHLNSFLRKNGIEYCFSPVYDRPYFNGGIKYACVIHDIQAVHFPQYHPFHEVVYSKLIWHADKVRNVFNIATTNYTKDDMVRHFKFKPDGIKVIYISVPEENKMKASYGDMEGHCDINDIRSKYGLSDNEPYYYTIAQMIPHKNLPTLVKTMALIKEKYPELPQKLLVTGISGNGTDEFDKMVGEAGVSDNIIKTGFVSNAEKVTLYKNCEEFLFPSVFEGFGMTPIEAMRLGATVVTTRCTSIPEVTQGICNYVEDPYSPENWIETMTHAVNRDKELDLSKYDEKSLSYEYYKNLFEI